MGEILQSGQEALSDVVMEHLLAPNLDIVTANQIISEVKEDYLKPKRYYHTFGGHILRMAGYLESHISALENPRVVLWSTIFHDAVYNLGPDVPHGKNESDSGVLAVATLFERLPDDEVSLIDDFIKTTASHDTSSQNPDLLLFLDADMSILGAPRGEYIEYYENIGKEYSWADPLAYKTGRLSALKGFKERPKIFLSTLGEELEVPARENIDWEIETLKSRLPRQTSL